ncbi:hypothetical protein [Bordetella muralis]|uniref:hypothetical protein n=1 Tax=Bordetella muralis TaxID=1649130 RepID=UPI0039EF3A56
MSRFAVCAGLFSIGALLIGAPSQSRAQEAAGAQVAQTLSSMGRPAPGTDTFGQPQYVLSGEPIVPPRDYSKSIEIPQPQDYDPRAVGIIYDVCFLGIEDGNMQFEIRGFSAEDLDFPESGQTIEFPVDQKTIVIRDLTIEVDEVLPGSLTYVVRRS